MPTGLDRYGSYVSFTSDGKSVELDLASDIVIPNPWHPNRIVKNLGSIGESLCRGTFKQTNNHSVDYCWLLCVGVVTGGNHSIAQAIIRGQGKLQSECLVDLSLAINSARFTGSKWFDISNGEEIYLQSVGIELGWSWEIGRLLLKYEDAYNTHILARK